MHLVFGAVFSTFFIIGICTLLLGCNPDIDGQCIAYDLIDGIVYGYKFEEVTCSRCTARTTKGRCIHTEYYDCYNSYLRYHYDNNQTCLFETVSGSKSEEDAYNGAVKYQVGYERTLIKRKSSSVCISPAVGMDTWITGVAFLSLCGIVLLAWVAFLIGEQWEQIGFGTSNRVVPSNGLELPVYHVREY